MCAACGVPTHVPVDDVSQPAKFAALRNPSCRIYLLGGALAMMADNVENVITYWVLWEKFHSPELTGFEVFSHWLPFLLLSPYFGALADRHDCRKLIQGAQLLFMSVSACWGLLFATGTLRVWNACVLLVLHGMAGAIWMPAEQLMLEDFVGPADLPSAIRLNSTARSLGILLGPERGIFCNLASYLPLTVVMARTRYTGHTRGGIIARQRVGALAALRVFREVSKDRVIVAMIVLAGLGSFFVGSAIQTAMPAIATSMDGASGGTAYGVLLFANGLGGVLGGLLLEGTGWLRLSVRAAMWSTAVYGLSSALFAFSHDYLVAALLLVVGGIANLAAMSITQTVVQLLAPREKRGQVVGLYGVAANGLRIGSGFTVGLLGAVFGLRVSLGVSALAMVAGTAVVAGYLALGTRRRGARELAAARAEVADAAQRGEVAELPEMP